uniref:MARVEL domain-containing protein n=1 Tax=Podarcis muralis TaxID=64176 RepID=A0A670KBC4_PODMU
MERTQRQEGLIVNIACCYGITVGILAFLHCLLFLGFDVYEPSITTHKFKYTILVLDVTFSIIWTCLWFVGFCFLANQWIRSTSHYLLGTGAARTSITFAVLSVPCWVSQSSTPLLFQSNEKALSELPQVPAHRGPTPVRCYIK